MATAWILPAGTDSASGVEDGDYLLRPDGSRFELGAVSGGVTWFGAVDASLLPQLPQVQEPQPAPEQDRVLLAVRGVESAEEHRGG